MKQALITLLLLISILTTFTQQTSNFIATDIPNFWTAYDKIRHTTDSVAQYNYINTLYIDKGTPGLKAIMQARSYTAKSFVDAINNYPLFWASIRNNTQRAGDYVKAIQTDVDKIKLVYPELKPADIYFTIGALRTGGTTLNGMVLIGSEIALADKKTVTTEFPERMSHLRPYFDTNPIETIVFGNVHEYIHTQQQTTICSTLLGQSVMEGVAEFIAVKATGKQSTLPAISYGKQNFEQVRLRFIEQMFNPASGFWLYSNATNEFNTRDLGYYTGYEICERYYNKAAYKKRAVKEMIELDYNDLEALKKFVDSSGYFGKPTIELEQLFESTRPKVMGMMEFANGAQNVSPAHTTLTLQFSEKLDPRFRSFELGPLGEGNLLRLQQFRGFADDGKSASVDIELKPNRQYQIIIGAGFRNEKGITLKPYLIDFKTGPM